MDKEEKSELKEAPAADNPQPEEVENDPVSPEEKKADHAHTLEKTLAISRNVGSLFLKKWIWLSALGLILITVTLYFILAPKVKRMIQMDSPPPISAKKMINENLREESLSPFFIPLPPHSSKQVIRVDLSVIWDGLAAVRFRHKEITIRDLLYQYMSGKARQEADFNKVISSLEDEMSGMMKNSLGVVDVAIRIREINYL
jgi:hypothetical protein